jgi:hypothetical protein
MTQLLPIPRLRQRGDGFASRAVRAAVEGVEVKSVVRIGLAAWVSAVLLAPVAVVAQDNIPQPAPLPSFRVPAADIGAGVVASTGVETIVETIPEAAPAEPVATASAPSAATAAEAVTAVALPKQRVTLTAQITENGMKIPEGLVWRVFDTRTDSSGELALISKSEDATATFELSPGEYVVHVAYGHAMASEVIQVAEGGASSSIVLDAGALRLNAAVTGDIAIPINLLRFDIFEAGSEGDRKVIAQNVAANDIVTLGAGTYHVVSYFGSVNAVVRADLRVEPGQLTEATLYHKAAQVTFKLVTEAGGEAVADVDWTVKTTSGDTVFTDIGAFPATVLAEGDYLVFAKRGEDVFNREFEVQPGQVREIEVLTTVY